MSNDPASNALQAAIIQIVREQANSVSLGSVSDSALSAVALVNAFNAHYQTGGASGVLSHRENVIEFYTQRYRAAITAHLDEIIAQDGHPQWS